MRLADLYRPETPAALLRFAVGGALSIGVSLGVTALLHEVFAVSEPIAAAVGLGCTVVVNFIFLRYVVFVGADTTLLRQLALFLGSSGIFRLFEYGAFLVLHLWLGIGYLIALPGVRVLSFFIKFVVYDRIVFARPAARHADPDQSH